MKRDVTAKYWSFESTRPGQHLAGVLEEIAKLSPVGSREQELEKGYPVRLERFEIIGDLVVGEVCRIQRDNIPPTVDSAGMTPMELTDGRGLGHRSAFVSNRSGDTVLWQQDQMACSPDKFAVYLGHYGTPCYSTQPSPFATANVWTEIENPKASIRYFSIKVAPQRNLDLFAGEEDPIVKELARQCASAYNGDFVDVSVSLDKSSEGSLDRKNVIGTLRKAKEMIGTRKIRALVKGENSAMLLDFLNRHQLETGKIERFPDNIESDWKARKGFLLDAFNGTLAHADDDEEAQ
ncbi:hypothetical protein D1224_09365 [Henriciella barbarensis]|uniref:Uncharacterized protein n=1 Tax=Henriciella barbarensis TaxID=86342 RepID=A0A399R2J6_9PROT|nr:hypothetical protein [Henriciella barbarensis]RIJ24425.1 hypothetical protein D1224_09365 [Henriciella barbarensis]